MFLLSAKVQRPYEDIDVDFKPENPETKDSNNSRLSQKVAYPFFLPQNLDTLSLNMSKLSKRKLSNCAYMYLN